MKAHAGAASALQVLQAAIATTERRAKDIRDVAGEVRRSLQSAEQAWEQLKKSIPAASQETDWARVKPRIDTDAFPRLVKLETDSRYEAAALRENGVPADGQEEPGATKQMGLADLVAHVKELADALGLDRALAVQNRSSSRDSPFSRRTRKLHAESESMPKERRPDGRSRRTSGLSPTTLSLRRCARKRSTSIVSTSRCGQGWPKRAPSSHSKLVGSWM